MNRKAIYPGSFDPITFGHIDIIERASRIYDKVFVAVAESREKKPLFTLSERIGMVKKATKSIKNVSVEPFCGLSVKYVKNKGCSVIVRGLRMISDFEYEFQMALTNRKLAPDIETIFLMPNESYSYISSKLIKEAAQLGGDMGNFVPSYVKKALVRKLHKKRKRNEQDRIFKRKSQKR